MSDLEQLIDLVTNQHYAVKSVRSTSKGTTVITLVHHRCSCHAGEKLEPVMMVTTDPEARQFAESRTVPQ